MTGVHEATRRGMRLARGDPFLARRVQPSGVQPLLHHCRKSQMHSISEVEKEPWSQQQVLSHQLMQQACNLMEAQTSAFCRAWIALAFWPWRPFPPRDLRDPDRVRAAKGTSQGNPEPIRGRGERRGNVVYVKFGGDDFRAQRRGTD